MRSMQVIHFEIFLQPDYDDIDVLEGENRIKLMSRGKSDKGKDNKKYGKSSNTKLSRNLT